MANKVIILSVKRLSDNKVFSLDDPVESEGFWRGIIDGFQQFEDDFRVHLDMDQESDREYFSISELD